VVVKWIKKEVRGKEPEYLRRQHASFKYLTKTWLGEYYKNKEYEHLCLDSTKQFLLPKRLLKRIIRQGVLNSVVFEHDNEPVMITTETNAHLGLREGKNVHEATGMDDYPETRRMRKRVLSALRKMHEEANGVPHLFDGIKRFGRFNKILRGRGVETAFVQQMVGADAIHTSSSGGRIRTIVYGQNVLSGMSHLWRRVELKRAFLAAHTHPLNKRAMLPEPSEEDIRSSRERGGYVLVVPIDIKRMYAKIEEANKKENIFTKEKGMNRNTLNRLTTELVDEYFASLGQRPGHYPTIHRVEGNIVRFYGVRIT
jgi:hypothetical protein